MDPEHPESDYKKEGTQKVVVTDIKMTFPSMIVFMVKWVIASIPALFILILLGTIFAAILKSCIMNI